MVKAAAAAGSLDEREAVLEILTSLRRAGADTIITYHAKDAARWLAEHSWLERRAVAACSARHAPCVLPYGSGRMKSRSTWHPRRHSRRRGDAQAAQPQGRRGDPARGRRPPAAEPDAGQLPDRAAAVRARGRAGRGHRGRGDGARAATCSTSASSARSRRSSTRGRSATPRCWSPPRSTPSTRIAPPR